MKVEMTPKTRRTRAAHVFILALGVALALGSQAQTNAPAPWRFNLSVTDAPGQPVAGAFVRIYHRSRNAPGQPEDFELRQSLITDTNGALQIPLLRGGVFIVAGKAGWATTWHSFQARNPTRDWEERLVLVPPSTLAGKVVDLAGQPLPSAQVWVNRALKEKPLESGFNSTVLLGGKIAREFFSARTDAEGRFRIESVPPDATVDLAASKPGKFLRPPRDLITPLELPFHAGQKDLELTLEPAGVIEGNVISLENGQPLPGVRLSLQPARPGPADVDGPAEVESGADGAFRLTDVAAGWYQIRLGVATNVTLTESAPLTWGFSDALPDSGAPSNLAALPEWVAEPVPVTVEAGQTQRAVQVWATHGGMLEIVVLEKDGPQPAAQAEVHVVNATSSDQTVTGPDGFARLRLPPGEYRVFAYRTGSRSDAVSAQLEPGQTNRLELEITSPPKIRGTVRDPSGAPAANLSLQVFPALRAFGGEAQTDTQGRYELAWNPGPASLLPILRRTKPCLLVRDAARNLAAAEDLDADMTTLDLRLEPGLMVAGRMEDAQGKPLAHIPVHLFLASAGGAFELDDQPIRTDKEGRFAIPALPPERPYRLSISARGYGQINFQLRPEDETPGTNHIEPFVLRAANRKIAGQVVDANDNPVAAARVHIQGEHQPDASVPADAQGRFTLDACEGQALLTANHPTTAAYDGTVTALGGDTNVVLKLGVTQRLASLVRRSNSERASLKGRPLPDLRPLGLPPAVVPTNQPILLCLFDSEQRPSRQMVRQLAERHAALRQQGVTVLGLQTVVLAAQSFRQWKDANPLPFPIAQVAENSAGTRWALQVPSLPWLILTDAQGRIADEGFPLEELDNRLIK